MSFVVNRLVLLLLVLAALLAVACVDDPDEPIDTVACPLEPAAVAPEVTHVVVVPGAVPGVEQVLLDAAQQIGRVQLVVADGQALNGDPVMTVDQVPEHELNESFQNQFLAARRECVVDTVSAAVAALDAPASAPLLSAAATAAAGASGEVTVTVLGAGYLAEAGLDLLDNPRLDLNDEELIIGVAALVPNVEAVVIGGLDLGLPADAGLTLIDRNDFFSTACELASALTCTIQGNETETETATAGDIPSGVAVASMLPFGLFPGGRRRRPLTSRRLGRTEAAADKAPYSYIGAHTHLLDSVPRVSKQLVKYQKAAAKYYIQLAVQGAAMVNLSAEKLRTIDATPIPQPILMALGLIADIGGAALIAESANVTDPKTKWALAGGVAAALFFGAKSLGEAIKALHLSRQNLDTVDPEATATAMVYVTIVIDLLLLGTILGVGVITRGSGPEAAVLGTRAAGASALLATSGAIIGSYSGFQRDPITKRAKVIVRKLDKYMSAGNSARAQLVYTMNAVAFQARALGLEETQTFDFVATQMGIEVADLTPPPLELPAELKFGNKAQDEDEED